MQKGSIYTNTACESSSFMTHRGVITSAWGLLSILFRDFETGKNKAGERLSNLFIYFFEILWVEEKLLRLLLPVKKLMLALSSRFHCPHYFWIAFVFKCSQYILMMYCHDVFSDVSLIILFILIIYSLHWPVYGRLQRWYFRSLILLPPSFSRIEFKLPPMEKLASGLCSTGAFHPAGKASQQ